MKKILLAFLALGSSLLAFSQGVWSPRATLPDSTRGYGIGFSIGNYGYIGLGTHNAHVNYPCLDDFWQFDPNTNSWTRKANFPGEARICPATFVIGNYAYIVTGQVSDSSSPKYTSECWRYNSSTNIWTQKANFPGSPRAYGAGFAIGGKGYVGTGSDYLSHYCKDFWQYDTATNSWTQKTNFGGIARYASSGFAVGGDGYVCLGRDSLGKWHKDMWEYDTSTNSWTQKSNYPGYNAFGASGFIIGTNIYFGCTQDSDVDLDNRFWQYNTVSDIWMEETTFPGHLRTSCSAFAIADTGYLGLGLSYDSVPEIYFNTLYKFYPDSVLGIETMINNNEIVVYPNPVEQELNIRFSRNTIPIDIKVSDITGRELIFIHINAPSKITPINVATLAQGLYFITINTNGIKYTQKFLKID